MLWKEETNVMAKNKKKKHKAAKEEQPSIIFLDPVRSLLLSVSILLYVCISSTLPPV